MKRQVGIYSVLKHAVLWVCSLSCLIPFILLIISSFTEDSTIALTGYSFFPKSWSLDAYRYLLGQGGKILHAYGISLFVTVFGTLAGLAMTLMLAYPLSRPDLPGRRIFSFYVLFTLLFNGGLVPSYIMWTTIFHIKNTIWALVIPNLMVKAFFVIMARSYFKSNIPLEIIESARIDGASEIGIFTRIVLPLSKPIVSTLLLFIGLSYWNDWNNGLIYLTDSSLYSIQNVLNEMIKSITSLSTMGGSVSSMTTLPSNTVRMAIAVVGTLPVLMAYPFLQKGFVKGIVMGGVKG
ncbi:carbohydrate ABC transporter permease [Diplocloster agilis]|uniref:carbohydrate ABC transporter permease n=1 Tax=Diplocloster agilis TaxID=2850323 RepID=UPI000820A505|nr:carbohydrate ABC transporter permease [Suonthocola fibrivorans]MCU6732680.1 carbohydrate ABC transporter permease [Suonthocola fibrivorans]SCI56952.1 Inner membrane ABC transporter permease protein ycjP [uncultured Clostridium sp.]